MDVTSQLAAADKGQAGQQEAAAELVTQLAAAQEDRCATQMTQCCRTAVLSGTCERGLAATPLSHALHWPILKLYRQFVQGST
jgi:hypothetical protein